jgi:hypothetical protein
VQLGGDGGAPQRLFSSLFGHCLREAGWRFCGGNAKSWRRMADICQFRNFRLKISEAVFPRDTANFAAISANAKGFFLQNWEWAAPPEAKAIWLPKCQAH